MSAEVDLIEALKGERDHRLKLQSLMTDYLSGEIDSSKVVSQMAYLLDGPEQRAVEASTQAALGRG